MSLPVTSSSPHRLGLERLLREPGLSPELRSSLLQASKTLDGFNAEAMLMRHADVAVDAQGRNVRPEDLQHSRQRALLDANVPDRARRYGVYTDGPSASDVASGAASVGFGQKGDAVRELQRRLNAAGIQPPLAEDGMFGPKTEAALNAWKRSAGMEGNGVADKDTWSRLGRGDVKIDPEQIKKSKPDWGEWGPPPADPNKAPLGSVANKGELESHARQSIEAWNKANPNKQIPAEWASDPALHRLMMKESGGRVGVPNYTFGNGSHDPGQWSSVHDRLKNGEIWTKSTASGLFQLTTSNVKKYYPSGLQGIGNANEEIIGGLQYIKDRYGSPQAALAFHDRNNWY